MGKCLFMRKGETHSAPNVGLPSGYTELTYIESTGTQYVDTVFKPNHNTRLVFDFEPTVSHTAKTVFGARIANRNDAFALWIMDDTTIKTDYGDNVTNITTNTLQRLSIDKNQNITTVNGVTVTTTEDTFQSEYSLFLFGMNQAGSLDSRTSSGKLYSCQIYDNGTLVRDFLPCINPSGEIGLYDTVNKKFYGNAGTGVFKCNADFANCTWEEIIEVCQTNTVPSTWEIGDSKSMIIDGIEHVIDIIGKNHDEYADGSGKAPLTFQLHYLWHFKLPMNEDRTNDLGWDGSDMRKIRMPELLSTMPSEVQSAIKEVNKRTSTGENSSTIKTSADKLFLLSEIEVAGTTEYSFAGEGTQYAYYAAGNSAIKQLDGLNAVWWLRSPLVNSAVYFVTMEIGAVDYSAADGSEGVAFAFCF